MGPTNRPKFTWSFIRFYLFWLLTTLLILFPLIAFFSNVVDCEECKRKQRLADDRKEIFINYVEVNKDLNTLTNIIQAINIDDPSELHLDKLNKFRNKSANLSSSGKIDSLSIKIKDVSDQIFGLSNRYEKQRKSTESLVKNKEKEIIDISKKLKTAQNNLEKCTEYQGL